VHGRALHRLAPKSATACSTAAPDDADKGLSVTDHPTGEAQATEKLGTLAAVAAIRTALNIFLAREIREEQRVLAPRCPADRPEPPASGDGVVR